jgi:hypothetical protein
MSDIKENFELSSHEYYGERLKLAHQYLDQLRSALIYTYPKSSIAILNQKQFYSTIIFNV